MYYYILREILKYGKKLPLSGMQPIKKKEMDGEGREMIFKASAQNLMIPITL